MALAIDNKVLGSSPTFLTLLVYVKKKMPKEVSPIDGTSREPT